MRTWRRVAVSRRCGGCGQQMPVWAPALFIEMVRGTRTLTFIRCAVCEGPAPSDLPPVVARPGISPSQLYRVGQLVLGGPDWKQRAAAEREPGEEG
jgi:hypothetical protein